MVLTNIFSILILVINFLMFPISFSKVWVYSTLVNNVFLYDGVHTSAIFLLL